VYSESLRGLKNLWQYIDSLKQVHKYLFCETNEEMKDFGNELNPVTHEIEKVLEWYNNIDNDKKILFLSPKRYISFSGLLETNVMFIMEPMSLSKTVQLKGRVIREESHKSPEKKRVEYIQYCCTAGVLYKHYAKFLDWLKSDKAALPFFTELRHVQILTPDELVLRGQRFSLEMEAAIFEQANAWVAPNGVVAAR
jgi:hypothetical protein